MITNHKSSTILLLALCAFTSLCVAGADSIALSAPAATAQKAPKESAKVAATPSPRITLSRRSQENLERHVSSFVGPIGPTLPAGATLHRNPAAYTPTLRWYEVSAAPDDVIFDLPPGAFLRRTVQTP